jgi:O-antigen/teichoic acid export membrane protein
MILDKRIDTLLVGFFLSPVEVGFYTLADRVVRFVEMPMSALGFTLSPMFGSEKASGNIERISRLYETALVNTLLLYIPAAAGIVLVADPLIRLVFGPAFSGAIIVLQVLGLYIILKAVTKLTDNGLNYLGRARDRAIFRAATAVLNVVLNVALLPVFGVAGAAVATLISYGLYTAANLYVVSLELELRSGVLVKQLVSISLITTAMSAVVFGLVGYISGWITLFLVVGTGGLIWGVLSVLTGLLEPRTLISTFR